MELNMIESFDVTQIDVLFYEFNLVRPGTLPSPRSLQCQIKCHMKLRKIQIFKMVRQTLKTQFVNFSAILWQ